MNVPLDTGELVESNLSASHIVNSPEVVENVNFWGFFQYHTAYYRKYQDYWRSRLTRAKEWLPNLQILILL